MGCLACANAVAVICWCAGKAAARGIHRTERSCLPRRLQPGLQLRGGRKLCNAGEDCEGNIHFWHTFALARTHAHACTHARAYTHAHTYMHTHTPAYAHARAHAHTHMRAQTQTRLLLENSEGHKRQVLLRPCTPEQDLRARPRVCLVCVAQDWIEVGKRANRCHCKKDCVRISMSLFDSDWNSDSEEDESEVGAGASSG